MAVNFQFCCCLSWRPRRSLARVAARGTLWLLLCMAHIARAAPGADGAAEPVAVPATAPASTPLSVPLYRSDLPAPATLHYLLRRSWLSGEGQLRWTREAGGYTLTLEGSLAGLKALSQTSSGTVESWGLSPQRFTDQRTKGAHSAVFQRDKASITFDAGPEEVPWVAGAQDRLSWMVQLPAIVRAEPARQAPGQSVALYVAGARGDAEVWTFRFVGLEEVRVPAGKLAAAKWVREPRKPHDTSVEVWLASSVQHLPVRARLSSGGGDGDALELLLQRSAMP
jgi:hypothetical protein